MALPFRSFEHLPLEMLYHIFSLTTPDALGNLANTSKAMQSTVKQWVLSGEKEILNSLHLNNFDWEDDENIASTLKAKYAEYGILIRRLTCLNPTMMRLRFADQFLRQIPGVPFYNSFAVLIVPLPMECLGQFFKAFMLGWEDFDCLKAFEYIEKKSNMEKTVSELLYKKEGVFRDTEVSIRLAYRCIFIDSAKDSQKKLFWIQQIFSNKSTYHKSKLMYILFGPTTSGGTIDWDLPTNMPPGDTLTRHEKFREIGQIIQFLETKNWEGRDFIMWALYELISLPETWQDASIAAIIYHAGPTIEASVLSDLLSKGFVTKSYVISSMILFMSDYNYERFINTVKVMMKTLDSRRYFTFIRLFFETLNTTCIDVYGFYERVWSTVMLLFLSLPKNVRVEWGCDTESV